MWDTEKLYARFRHVLWQEESNQQSRFKRIVVYFIRLLYAIVQKFADGQLNLWSMNLAYTTLLSLVPLLAISFSVLKAFGVQNQLQPVLLEFLAPLHEQGVEITNYIIEFVNNIRVGVLSSVSMAFLFYTVISLLNKVEAACNAIWQVPNTRSLGRRFSDYLSVTLVGPVLLFAALGLTTAVLDNAVVQELTDMEPFGTLLLVGTHLVPYVLICAAFTFLYKFLPNTSVRLSAALTGGIFAGLLWYASGAIFAKFVVGSSNYSAIYSGFAGAILFIIWLNISWLILLVGAQVAFYWQNPQFLALRHNTAIIGSQHREALALMIMTLLGRAHYYHGPLWTLNALEAYFQGVPTDTVSDLVDTLEKQGLIIASATNPSAYLPVHDLETIALETVIAAVRGTDESPFHFSSVDAVIRRIDTAIGQALCNKTVKDLVVESQGEKLPQRL